jgi:hypothetical protein
MMRGGVKNKIIAKRCSKEIPAQAENRKKICAVAFLMARPLLSTIVHKIY